MGELVLNRPVEALKPRDGAPPWWHVGLDHLGLFFFYFATTLGLACLLQQLVQMWQRRRPYGPAPRTALLAIGALFLALAAASVVYPGDEAMSFVFQSVFVAFVITVLVAQLTVRGDLAAKIGLLVFAVPLLIRYYTPFALHFLEGSEARYGDLPIDVQEIGQWSLVVAASASPYLFAPRPLASSLLKPIPAAVALFVGVLAAVVLRQHMDVGVLIAKEGFGFEIAAGAPEWTLALYLLALAEVCWTITACFLAESPARREIGLGIALVVVAGFGFTWSLQFVLAATGLFLIGSAALRVSDEESGAVQAARPTTPPIPDAVWQSYVMELLADLRERDGSATTLTSRGDGGAATTHLVATVRDVPLRVRIERVATSVVWIDIVCGQEAAESLPPVWTLHSRVDRALGVHHPEPPRSAGAQVRTGDAVFDLRFRARDTEAFTGVLLDDALRARLAASFDGWLAFWPGKGVRYRVHPGVGVPLDHPIPISAMALRGSGAAMSPDRFVALIDLLVEITTRGEQAPTAATAATT